MTVSEPRLLALNVDLSSAVEARIVEAAQGFRVVSRAELRESPALLDRAEVLFTLFTKPERIVRAPTLRWIQTYGAGIEWLLVPEVVHNAQLRVTNARGIHAQPIAEHVFGLVLALVRKLHLSYRQQLEGRWDPEPLRKGLATLEGATLGVLGLGEIGRRIAQIGSAFGMRVIGLRRKGGSVAGVAEVFREDQLERLLAASDVVVNALPLTAATRGLLGRRQFAAMRPHALFVNIGRGASVDSEALVSALRAGELGGAGLDVTAPEPLPAGHPLWQLPNVLITPHYSGAHPGYEQRVASIFIDNIARYLRGEPLVNLVDKAAGY